VTKGYCLAASAMASCLWLVPCHGAEPLAALMACRALTDTTARLACFDRESASLDLKAASATAAATPHAPPLDSKQQFGLPERSVATQEIAAGTRAAEATTIEAHITQLSQGTNGRFTYALDNAQIWRQLGSTGDLLLKTGDAVTISRGTLGSYWMQGAGKRGCKVARVR
jgi:hypothetical protein